MWKLLIESIIIGIITSIIGIMIFNLSINKNNSNNDDKPYGITTAFFITGVFIHIISTIL